MDLEKSVLADGAIWRAESMASALYRSAGNSNLIGWPVFNLADLLQHSRGHNDPRHANEARFAQDYDQYHCIKLILDGIEEACALEERLMRRYDVGGAEPDDIRHKKHRGYFYDKLRLLMLLYENWDRFRSLTIPAINAGDDTADYSALSDIKGIGPFSYEFMNRLYKDCNEKQAQLRQAQSAIAHGA